MIFNNKYVIRIGIFFVYFLPQVKKVLFDWISASPFPSQVGGLFSGCLLSRGASGGRRYPLIFQQQKNTKSCSLTISKKIAIIICAGMGLNYPPPSLPPKQSPENTQIFLGAKLG